MDLLPEIMEMKFIELSKTDSNEIAATKTKFEEHKKQQEPSSRSTRSHKSQDRLAQEERRAKCNEHNQQQEPSSRTTGINKNQAEGPQDAPEVNFQEHK